MPNITPRRVKWKLVLTPEVRGSSHALWREAVNWWHFSLSCLGYCADECILGTEHSDFTVPS